MFLKNLILKQYNASVYEITMQTSLYNVDYDFLTLTPGLILGIHEGFKV